MRRLLAMFLVVTACSALPARALTVKEVAELAKAGVGEEVLLALIETDPRVYTMDPAAVKLLKEAGVTDPVIVALIRSGRTPVDQAQPQPVQPEPVVDPGLAPTPAGQVAPPEPRVIVIDHHDSAPVVQQVPVAVPVYVPTTGLGFDRQQRVRTNIVTHDGAALNVNVPLPSNCVRAEPVYWGNGGKRRPGTWAPPAQVVCR